jgi:uncharacterized protein YbaR (Trm112 family)
MELIKITRIVICPVCKKELEVRKGIFAHETLSRHSKEHDTPL